MPTPEYYDVGEIAVIEDTIDVDGVLTDPSTLTISYRKPNGTEVTKTYGTDPEVVRQSVGVYHLNVTCDSAGEWAGRVSASGLASGAGETSWHVRASRF